MKDQSSLIGRILLIIVIALMTLITACNGANVDERVEMTLTALFTFQPTSTNTDIPTIEPSTTPTYTQLPPTETQEPAASPTETQKPSCFKLLNPPKGAYLQTTGKLYFEWDPLEGAEIYVLDISAPYGRKQQFESSVPTVMRWLDTLPSAGPYTWQVTALDANGEVMCIEGPYDFNKPKFKPTSTPKSENPLGVKVTVNCDDLPQSSP